MGRRVPLLRSSLLRSLLQSRISKTPSSQYPPLLPHLRVPSPPQNSPPLLFPLPQHSSHPFLFSRRTFSSSTSPSNIVIVESEKEFNTFLKKVEDEKLPAVFYFTAAWCGPCKFIYPTIEEMSKKFPHVTTYKIDIDLEGLQSTLSKLWISSVPTLHFFQNGKKADEVVGADAARLTKTMENLYKLE